MAKPSAFLLLKKSPCFWTLTVTLLFHSAYGQHWLGLSSSNYAGTHALHLNPAHAADSRHKFYLNLIGNDFFIINNYLSYNAPYSFLSLITNSVSDQYRNDRGLIIWRDSYYAERLNGRRKHLHAGGDLRGPSLLYSFNKNRMAIGLTTRGRYLLNMTNTSEETARLIRYGTDLEEIQKQSYQNQTGMMNINGYLELGGTFGMVLADDDEYFVKIGATVKRVVGLYNVHADLQNANYRIQIESLNRNREFIETAQLQARYGYTGEGSLSGFSPDPRFLFGNRSAGGGWGVDIGIVYEHRPDIRKYKRGNNPADPNQNKYKYRFSAALNDFGAIRYRNLNFVRQASVNIQNAIPPTIFSYVRFNDLNSATEAANAVNRSVGLADNFEPKAFTVGLPTTANISMDYHHQGPWYINALWIQGLRSAKGLAIKPQTVLAVTPRYERKWVEVSAPLALLDSYRVLAVGIAARVGPVIIGTDHLGGLLNIGKPRGLDFYFALYAPFFHRKPKDPNKCWYLPYEKPARRR